MLMRWGAFYASSKSVDFVIAEVNGSGIVNVLKDQTIKLPTGEYNLGLHSMFKQISELIVQEKIERVVISAASAPPKLSKKTVIALMSVAEVRGVVIAACNGVPTQLIMKAQVSKHFGNRKFDEYVKDDAFWSTHTTGTLRKASRKAALLILCKAG